MSFTALEFSEPQSFEEYMRTANSLNREIAKVPGIIMFEIGDALPQDVVLFPVTNTFPQRTAQLFSSITDQAISKAVLAYFQSLRWLNPHLNKQLKGAQGLLGYANGNIWFIGDVEVKIAAGVFYFNRNTLPQGLKTHLLPKWF